MWDPIEPIQESVQSYPVEYSNYNWTSQVNSIHKFWKLWSAACHSLANYADKILRSTLRIWNAPLRHHFEWDITPDENSIQIVCRSWNHALVKTPHRNSSRSNREYNITGRSTPLTQVPSDIWCATVQVCKYTIKPLTRTERPSFNLRLHEYNQKRFSEEFVLKILPQNCPSIEVLNRAHNMLSTLRYSFISNHYQTKASKDSVKSFLNHRIQTLSSGKWIIHLQINVTYPKLEVSNSS